MLYTSVDSISNLEPFLIQEHYSPQLEALQTHLSSMTSSLSKLDIREIAVLANDLKIENCPEPDANKIALDKKRYGMTGMVCLDEFKEYDVLSSELNPRLEKALRLLRSCKFTEAANLFRETIQFR